MSLLERQNSPAAIYVPAQRAAASPAHCIREPHLCPRKLPAMQEPTRAASYQALSLLVGAVS